MVRSRASPVSVPRNCHILIVGRASYAYCVGVGGLHGGKPKLDLVIPGVRCQFSAPTRVRLIITLLIQCMIRQVLGENPTDFDSMAEWAACCLGFFGFHCSG